MNTQATTDQPTTGEAYKTPNYRDVVITEYNGKQYRVCAGFWFHINTPDLVMDAIASAQHGGRIRIYQGNVETGEDWGERYDITGTVGRSMGPVKAPLLIHNRRSMGGGCLLTDCLVKIRYTTGTKRVLYQHPTFKLGEYTVGPNNNADSRKKGYLWAVYRNGEQFYGCKTEEAANRELAFMTA